MFRLKGMVEKWLSEVFFNDVISNLQNQIQRVVYVGVEVILYKDKILDLQGKFEGCIRRMKDNKYMNERLIWNDDFFFEVNSSKLIEEFN